MQFTFLFKQRQDAPIDATAGKAAMGQFAAELARQGKLRRGGSLVESGATVRVRDGQAFVIDGPFAESKEVVAGFWIVEVASRAEAIDIARRCPHARHG